MNKKSAFIVVKDLPRKTALLGVYNYTNVPTVINNF